MSPRVIVIIAAALVILGFFTAWAELSVSAFGESDSGNLSGWDIATADDDAETDAFVVLAAAAACIVVGYLGMSRQISAQAADVIVIAAAAIGAFIFWDNYSFISDTGNDFGIDVSFGIGGWLTLLGFAGVIGAAGYSLLGQRQSQSPATQQPPAQLQ